LTKLELTVMIMTARQFALGGKVGRNMIKSKQVPVHPEPLVLDLVVAARRLLDQQQLPEQPSAVALLHERRPLHSERTIESCQQILVQILN
jgi:hypothetical protein